MSDRKNQSSNSFGFIDNDARIDDKLRSEIDPVNRLLDQFLKSEGAVDATAGVLKTLNDLYGETPDNPIDEPVGFIMNKVVRAVDEVAATIGSQSNTQVRSTKEIVKGIAGDGSSYTGFEDLTYPRRPDTSASAPNLLRIYLGLDENTLDKSEDAPTDFTKGTPSSGWRSIKRFTAEPIFQTASESNTRGGGLVSEDFRNRFQDMDKHVRDGDYVPSRDIISSGEVSWLPVEVRSDVDLGGFTQSIGYDKEKDQYYLSVVDIWDFEPETYGNKWGDTSDEEANKFLKSQAKLMNSVGQGIGIYDRYYIPDDVIDEWRKPEPKRVKTEKRSRDSYFKMD